MIRSELVAEHCEPERQSEAYGIDRCPSPILPRFHKPTFILAEYFAARSEGFLAAAAIVEQMDGSQEIITMLRRMAEQVKRL